MRLTFIFFLYSCFASAQISVGVRTGMNFHFHDATNSYGDYPIYHTSAPNLHLSVPIDIQIQDWVGVDVKLSYSQRSLRTDSDIQVSPNTRKPASIYYRPDFLELSTGANFRYRFGKVQPFLGVALISGLKVRHEGHNYSIISFNNSIEFNESPVTSIQTIDFQLGLDVNCGLRFFIDDKVSICLEGSYNRFFTPSLEGFNQFYWPYNKNYFEALGFGLGFGYAFK